MASTPKPTEKSKTNHDVSNLSGAAQDKKKTLEGFLRTPLVVNDSAMATNEWTRDRSRGMTLLEHTLQKAAAQSQPVVIGLMESHGEEGSVLGMSRLWSTSDNPIKAQTMLAPLIKAGVIDVREQMRYECAIEAFSTAKRQHESSVRQHWYNRHSHTAPIVSEPASWDRAFADSDATVWGRWMLGDGTGLTAAVSRDVVKRWAPVLAKQHPQDTPKIIHGALSIAAQAWDEVKLPKASSPSPFTPEQKDLHFLLGVCEKVVASVEKALAAAGHSVSRKELVPESIQTMQDAFEAKALKESEREKSAQEARAAREAAGEEGEASDDAAERSRAQARIEKGRYTMARTATEHLDFKALLWITQNDADQGAWIGVPENGGGLLELVANKMRVQAEPREVDIDQRLGVQLLSFFLEKGLNLLEEAAVSHQKTDNPFARLEYLCSLQGGAWNTAITAATLRHMREAGLELSDAEAFFEETLATKTYQPEKRASFEMVARAGLQRWQLDADLEQHAKEKALASKAQESLQNDGEPQGGHSAGEGEHDRDASNASEPSAAPVVRRRHRL